AVEAALELGAPPREEDDDVERRSKAPAHLDPGRERREEAREAVGCARECDAMSRLDPELARQRRSRVSRHSNHMRAPAGALTCCFRGKAPHSHTRSYAVGVPIDDGQAIHYSAIKRGTPVYSSDEFE